MIGEAVIQEAVTDDGWFIAALVSRGRVRGRFDEYGTFYLPGSRVPAFQHPHADVREFAEEAEQMFEALEELR